MLSYHPAVALIAASAMQQTAPSLRPHVRANRATVFSTIENDEDGIGEKLSSQLNAVTKLRPAPIGPEAVAVQAALWEAAGLNPAFKVSGIKTGEPSFTRLFDHAEWNKVSALGFQCDPCEPLCQLQRSSHVRNPALTVHWPRTVPDVGASSDHVASLHRARRRVAHLPRRRHVGIHCRQLARAPDRSRLSHPNDAHGIGHRPATRLPYHQHLPAARRGTHPMGPCCARSCHRTAAAAAAVANHD